MRRAQSSRFPTLTVTRVHTHRSHTHAARRPPLQDDPRRDPSYYSWYYANRALSRLLEPHIPEALRAELHPVADDVLGRVK